MESKSFCYWLQGFFELEAPTEINAKQTELIKKHLSMVFKHEIDPAMGDAAHQAALNTIHNKPRPPLTGGGTSPLYRC